MGSSLLIQPRKASKRFGPRRRGAEEFRRIEDLNVSLSKLNTPNRPAFKGDPNSSEAPYLVILYLACLMSDCQWDGGKSHKLTCALFARVSSQYKSYTIWNIDIWYAWPKFNLRLIPFLWLGFILYSTLTSSSTCKAQRPYSNGANLFDDGRDH